MSLLSDFAKSAFAAARQTIGGESLTIAGGAAVSVVLSEVSDSQTYEDTGFMPVASFQAVIDSVEFSAAYTASIRTYIGKIATCRSRQFRIVEIVNGRSFVTLRLETTNRA
jgi:hypothetical protein